MEKDLNEDYEFEVIHDGKVYGRCSDDELENAAKKFALNVTPENPMYFHLVKKEKHDNTL